jgi:hypothetical protein
MDDIIKYDVRTYVEELIKREFLCKNNEGKSMPSTDNARSQIGKMLDAATSHEPIASKEE